MPSRLDICANPLSWLGFDVADDASATGSQAGVPLLVDDPPMRDRALDREVFMPPAQEMVEVAPAPEPAKVQVILNVPGERKSWLSCCCAGPRCLLRCCCAGPRCFCRLLRNLILVDLTFQFTWSKILYGACVLEVTRSLSEISLAQIFGQFDGSGMCFSNSAVDMCTPSGQSIPALAQFEIPIDPVNDEKLVVNHRALYAMVVILITCMVNSRYFDKIDLGDSGRGCCCGCLERIWTVAKVLLGLLALQGLVNLSVFQIRDMNQCRTRAQDDWSRFTSPPVTEDADALYISAWCTPDSFGALSENKVFSWLPFKLLTQVLAEEGGTYEMQRDGITEAQGAQHIRMVDTVKSLWAGYMANVTFQWSPADFCNVFHSSSKTSCISMLASTGVLEHSALSGSTMGLHYLGSSFSVVSSKAVAYHLLELAQHGIGCNENLPAGSPASTYPGGCTLVKEFVTRDDEGNIVVKDEAAQYMDMAFFECAIKSIQQCATRSYVKARAVFRSTCALISCCLLAIGFLRMLYLRLTYSYPGCMSRWVGKFRSRTWRPHHAEWFRIICGSRIFLALITCFLLQTSVTLTIISLVLPTRKDIDQSVATALGVPSATFVGISIIASIVLQWVIVVGLGVIGNIVLHIKLRSQVMRLRPEQFYGEEAPPNDWSGPDLAELREMGKTSVLYASYFTGFVFWRFLFASGIICLIAEVVAFALWYVWTCSHNAGELDHTRKVIAGQMWVIMISIAFSVSMLSVHYLARLWVTKCLLIQGEKGMTIRCHCLWTYCELLTCILSLAVGPFSVVLDFFKGGICTLLAMLIVQKPNFTQFGELCDYVYCTYCAELYLERVYEDRIKLGRHVADVEGSENTGSLVELSHHGSVVDLEERHHLLEYEEKPLLNEPSFTIKAPFYFLTFFLIVLGLPCLFSMGLDLVSKFFEYPCPCMMAFDWMPKVCEECSDGEALKEIMQWISQFRKRIQFLHEAMNNADSWKDWLGLK